MADNHSPSILNRIISTLVLIIFGIVYGYLAAIYNWIGAPQMRYVRDAVILVAEDLKRPWYTSLPGSGMGLQNLQPNDLAPGLVALAGIGSDEVNFIRVIDRDGEIVHSWRPDWFEIWPENDAVVPAGRIPKKQPGAVIHGLQILPDGDVLLNFEFLSTIRLTPCGDVRWKLDNLGHHSIFVAEDQTIWVTAERFIEAGDTGYDNHIAPLNSWAIQNISMDGKILQTIEVLDILRRNDLLGLMHLSSQDDHDTTSYLDTLHLNDVEIFPSDMASEIFESGDIMISLRNINTVLVVDPVEFQVKFLSTGKFLHQHDPDFAPNDKIFVYDNRDLEPWVEPENRFSRIVELDAVTGQSRVTFKGAGNASFYSRIMGRQQKLENGNFMIASAREGRALEVSENGELLWQYFNTMDEEFNGLLMEASVLPAYMDKEFFAQKAAECPSP